MLYQGSSISIVLFGTERGPSKVFLEDSEFELSQGEGP